MVDLCVVQVETAVSKIAKWISKAAMLEERHCDLALASVGKSSLLKQLIVFISFFLLSRRDESGPLRTAQRGGENAVS